MDTLTHLVLGAVTGELTARNQIGRKALALGAAAQYLPDVDVVAALWIDPAQNLMVHRGITHSFFFVVTGSLVLAWCSRGIFARSNLSWCFWIGFFGLQLSLHIFIDAFNAYGAGWLEPFGNEKISFHALYVFDPAFALPLLIALLIVLFSKNVTMRRRYALAGVSVAGLYLITAFCMQWITRNKVQAELERNAIGYDKILVTPAPLSSLLFFVAAADEAGFHTAHVSVFDKRDSIRFQFFPRNEHLLRQVREMSAVRSLKEFSNGFYTIERWGDTLVFNDLRFGQMRGWVNPKERFVFHYFVDYPEANTLVMQRGRFAGWDKETIRGLFIRMFGGTVSRADENKK